MWEWDHDYHLDDEELDYAYYEEDGWDGHRFWIPLLLLVMLLVVWAIFSRQSSSTVIIWEPGSNSSSSTASGQNAVI